MVGATVLGVFLQGLPPDRRVAMARVASLIRRAARGVRESKRFGLVFYELNGGPLFGLESREKSLTLYIAERSVIEPFLSTMKGIDAEHSLIEFTDLNRLPLPDIEKIVRASVVARRERQAAPSQSEILAMWGVKEEEAAVAPPVVRISMRTAEDEQAEAAAKAEVGKPFPQEQELRDKSARLAELDVLLNMDGRGRPAPEAVLAKSGRPSVLEGLKRPVPPRCPEKKPKHHEQEVR